MSKTLATRIDRLQRAPAARIAVAAQTGDWSTVSDDELLKFVHDGGRIGRALCVASDDDLHAIASGDFDAVKSDELRRMIQEEMENGKPKQTA